MDPSPIPSGSVLVHKGIWCLQSWFCSSLTIIHGSGRDLPWVKPSSTPTQVRCFRQQLGARLDPVLGLIHDGSDKQPCSCSGVTADNAQAALTPLLYRNYGGIMLFDN